MLDSQTAVRYSLRLKDDFAVRETVLVLHSVHSKLRHEYNRLVKLHESARHVSYAATRETVQKLLSTALSQLQQELTILVNRALRHKNWAFVNHPIPTQGPALYTGMLLCVDNSDDAGHANMSLPILLTTSDKTIEVVLEW